MMVKHEVSFRLDGNMWRELDEAKRRAGVPDKAELFVDWDDDGADVVCAWWDRV